MCAGVFGRLVKTELQDCAVGGVREGEGAVFNIALRPQRLYGLLRGRGVCVCIGAGRDGGSPRTSTSTFTQRLSSEGVVGRLAVFIYLDRGK